MENAPLVRIVDEPKQVITYDSVVNCESVDFEDDDDYNSAEEEEHPEDRPPHRFHYTFDDRTIEDVSQYFDLLSEDGLSVGDVLAEETRLRRAKSYDAEESIYFDAFGEEILPREEPIGPRQRLSPLALSVLVFYNVSGGPFGMERAVKSGGPLFAILGFIIFPLVWSIPEALVTAELGTAYPEPSGCIAWVEEAFGTKCGMIAGYLHWVSGATDNAIYPSLFLHYVMSIFKSPGLEEEPLSNTVRFIFTSIMTVLLAWINYRGLEIVGMMSIAVCIVSMSPFVVMCLIGAFQVQPSRWFQLPVDLSKVISNDDDFGTSGFVPSPLWANVLWRPLLNNLFWNLNCFDAAGSFAGEVAESGRVFPRAMGYSVLLVVLGYLLPLLVALGATDTVQMDWSEGYLANIATQIGGTWLGAWTVFAAGVSNLALFEAEMSSDAYQLMGMANRGLFPKMFSTQSKYDTPTYGILLGTFVVILMSIADFTSLVEMLNFAYSLALLFEFAAFIKLRISHADVPRPYRVPLNTFGCILMLIPPSLMTLFVMAYATKMTFLYISAIVIGGIGLFELQKIARKNDWCEYVHVHHGAKKA